MGSPQTRKANQQGDNYMRVCDNYMRVCDNYMRVCDNYMRVCDNYMRVCQLHIGESGMVENVSRFSRIFPIFLEYFPLFSNISRFSMNSLLRFHVRMLTPVIIVVI